MSTNTKTATRASGKTRAKAKRRFVLPVDLLPEKDGSYTAEIPLLPGCVTWGKTWAEALAQAKEAAELYIDVLLDDGKKVPEATRFPKGPTIVAEV